MSTNIITDLYAAYHARTRLSPKLRAYRRQIWTSRLRIVAIMLGVFVNTFLVIRGIGSLI